MPSADLTASATRRDLPLPVSPTTSISDPEPRRPGVPRLDGTGLALDREWLERGLLEAGLRPAQDLPGGVDVSGGRLGHEPGREVHGVSHHRVPPAVGRPDGCGE